MPDLRTPNSQLPTPRCFVPVFIWKLEVGNWEFLDEQALDLASARIAPAEQPGWKDPRVVEDEQIASDEIAANVRERGVLNAAGGAVEHE